MKTLNRFFYAALTGFASVALLASCEKDPQGGETPEPEPKPEEPTQLATPTLSVEEKTSTSFTVTWDAVTNAGSYTYTLNDGAEETTTSTSAEFTSLTAGEYTVKVKATSEDENYTDSEWASTTVTLEEEVTGGPDSWVGTWTATSEKSFAWLADPDNQGFVTGTILDKPHTSTLTINYDQEYDQYIIYGLSGMGAEYPAIGITDENGNLQIVNGIAISEASNGVAPTWIICWNILEGEFAGYTLWDAGSTEFAYTFELAETTTSEAQAMTHPDYGPCQMLSFDIYAFNASTGSAQIYTNMGESFNGAITLTYVSGETASAPSATASAKPSTSVRSTIQSIVK